MTDAPRVLVAMGVSGYTNCAQLRDGTASCWGDLPNPVPGIDQIVDIAAGEQGAVAVRADGTVWTWFSGTSVGTTTISTPVQVPGLGYVRHVTEGWGHRCALLGDGTVWCWGFNLWGELGDGTFQDHMVPAQVVGVANAAQIASGARTECALIRDGTVMCWGDNSHGEMGNGSAGVDQPVPTQVPGLTHVAEIRAGFWHTCARKWDYSVWCWGDNESGQVGDGTTTERLTPVQVFP